MDYQKTYDNLIRTRKERVLKDDVYYENHHIVPRCMRGSDDPDNTVLLTAREHFLAHWLLSEMHPKNMKLKFAFFAMCNWKNNQCQGKERIVSSKIFAIAREAHAKAVSILMTGKEVSVETRKVLSELAIRSWNSRTSQERTEMLRHARSFITSEMRKTSSQKANLSFTRERRSANAKKIQESLTPEQKQSVSEKNSVAKISYWAKMSNEQKSERIKKLNEAKKLRNANKQTD